MRYLKKLVVKPAPVNWLTTGYITVPKVGILNFCSGFRWTAVLESVQRNPLTNAITLQSIPLFWRFFCSEFRCKALDSTIKYLLLKCCANSVVKGILIKLHNVMQLSLTSRLTPHSPILGNNLNNINVN